MAAIRSHRGRREVLARGEHASGGGNPQRQAGLLIGIDPADLSGLADFTVGRGAAGELLNVLRVVIGSVLFRERTMGWRPAWAPWLDGHRPMPIR
jgi:hypothetical protein